jgi:homocysteine S-methyltransferase
VCVFGRVVQACGSTARFVGHGGEEGTAGVARGLFDLVGAGEAVLGDCAIETRLRFESPLATDEQLGLLPLVSDALGAATIRAVSASYTATAAELGLPIVIDAPTWWARPDRLAAHGITAPSAERLIRDCVALACAVRDRYDDVYVSAALGPSTDAYRPGTVDVEAAMSFHHQQAERLAATDADVLLAGTFSTVPDLQAAAVALAATGRPYVLGPTLDASGRLPDHTPLDEAIDRIESTVTNRPVYWSLCCVHPTVALAAMDALGATDSHAHDRIKQLKGNGSSLDAARRDSTEQVLADEPEAWASTATRLHQEHRLAVIGGCCGTDHRHLLSLATRLASRPH